MTTIPFSPPCLTREDWKGVEEVLRSGWITTGPAAARLEEGLSRRMEGQRVVCLSSCTAALELVLRCLGVGPGDEVITSPYTYTATAAAILRVGARPVFCDLGKGSYLLDPEQVAAALSPHTRAVIGVDVGGALCNWKALEEAVSGARGGKGWFWEEQGRIPLLADGAHSLGGIREGRPSGCLADFTCFSFHAVKNLTTAEGGAVTWRPLGPHRDRWLERELRLWSLHGQDRSARERYQAGGWEYDVLFPGGKYNLPDLLAVLGVSQLKRYDRTLSRRRALLTRYRQRLQEWAFFPDGEQLAGSACHLCMVQLREPARRDRLLAGLAGRGIGVNLHYRPLPMLTAYRRLGYRMSGCPQALERYKGEVSLPLYPSLTEEQQETVCRAVEEELTGKGRDRG